MARLIQGNDDEWVLRDEWSIDDVRACGVAGADEFDDNDCLNVLRIAETSWDAGIGINWDVIQNAAQFYITCKNDGTKMFYRGAPIKVTA